MITINCQGCGGGCCHNPLLTPVLLPSEEGWFKKMSVKKSTVFGDISVMRKKENGNCVFLDDSKKQCTIYKKRPLECVLYPFLLDFSGDEVGVKLDNRFCPSLKSLAFDKKAILKKVRQYDFPTEWIKKFNALEDC